LDSIIILFISFTIVYIAFIYYDIIKRDGSNYDVLKSNSFSLIDISSIPVKTTKDSTGKTVKSQEFFTGIKDSDSKPSSLGYSKYP
jgi:hypothetical protein